MYKKTSQLAKEIRQQLKAAFPGYKFSVTSKTYSGGRSINVALMEAPHTLWKSEEDATGYEQINIRLVGDEYGHGYGFNEQASALLKKAWEIADAENYDNSDHMTDYFDVNYYLHLNVGKWNQDFQVV